MMLQWVELKGASSVGGRHFDLPRECQCAHRESSGLAGTVLVYKIAGALARRGASLNEVYQVSQWVSTRLGTIGAGLEHCHVRSLCYS